MMEELAERAKNGDARALEELVTGVQDRVFNLALRMLGHPEDARDAAQEILVKVVTGLGTFSGQSAFSTWVHAVAANHLRDLLRKRARRPESSLEDHAEQIERMAARGWSEERSRPVQKLVAAEMRHACLLGLLACLDDDQRMAYVLGEIFEVSEAEGAAILGIGEPAFRKRLSRAREKLRDFMLRYCGELNPDAPCSCGACARAYERQGMNPALAPLARLPRREKPEEASRRLDALEAESRVAGLFRSLPEYEAPGGFIAHLRGLVDSGRITNLLTNS
ncbi:MAG: RNA polymerase sigma factor [Thermodesulfobacteriota bacterium]